MGGTRDYRGDGVCWFGTRFLGDARGTIAILCAVLMPVIVGAVFFAMDYSRAASLKSKLQNAADAAIVTASMELGGDNVAVREVFGMAFRANLPEKYRDQTYDLSITPDKKSLSVEMDAKVDTTIVQIVGLDEITLNVSAFATRPTPRSSAIAAAVGSGDDKGRKPNEDAVKRQIIREMQDGLRAARAAGIRIPDNMSEHDLERAADMIVQHLRRR